jgi:hypothetical protein
MKTINHSGLAFVAQKVSTMQHDRRQLERDDMMIVHIFQAIVGAAVLIFWILWCFINRYACTLGPKSAYVVLVVAEIVLKLCCLQEKERRSKRGAPAGHATDGSVSNELWSGTNNAGSCDYWSMQRLEGPVYMRCTDLWPLCWFVGG